MSIQTNGYKRLGENYEQYTVVSDRDSSRCIRQSNDSGRLPVRGSLWSHNANHRATRDAEVRQTLNGVNAGGQRKEGNYLVIRYLVVMCAISSEPVKRGTEFTVVETDQPAVIYLLKSACSTKLVSLCIKRRLV